MQQIELIAPCHFGLEAVLKREIYDLGYDIARVEDGRVTFYGDEEAVCRANVNLRTAERILLKAGAFHAETFDELFEQVRAIPWEDYIPADGRFWVTKASTVRSRLHSAPDIQSVTKKAIVTRLARVYGIRHFEETGASYPIRMLFNKDEVTVGLDTSGTPLHKRGYRVLKNKAPLSETLAASLLMLTPFRAGRILLDPFCGSGTFLIEAALMASNIAPGMHRTFTAQAWTNRIGKTLWDDTFEEARELVTPDTASVLLGSDIDANIIRAAASNAARAGVADRIRFETKPVSEVHPAGEYGFLIANPPYGERMEALPQLYKEIGQLMRSLDTWSHYLLTAYPDAERQIGRRAAKNRKIYNGMIRTYFYQYPGPKPPKAKAQAGEHIQV